MSLIVRGKQGFKGDRGDNGEKPVAKIFKVTVSNGEYYINGESKKTLKLIQGQKYIFDQTHTSNTNHPLKLSKQPDGNHPTKGAELSLSDGWKYQNGKGIYEPPNDIQESTIYYYCNNHANMGGTIKLIDFDNFDNTQLKTKIAILENEIQTIKTHLNI